MPHDDLAHRFEFALPGWAVSLAAAARTLDAPEARMKLAIELARANVEQGAGGPFGAVVVDLESHELVSVGVNLVVPGGSSILHAEMVALALAQKSLGVHDLRQAGPGSYELVASTEPCAMCLGALPWSGVCSLLCGGTDADAREIGFDEGCKPPDWAVDLEGRGITVHRECCRDEAVAVLRQYAAAGRPIY